MNVFFYCIVEIGIREISATNWYVCGRLRMHTFACYATYLTALVKIKHQIDLVAETMYLLVLTVCSRELIV